MVEPSGSGASWLSTQVDRRAIQLLARVGDAVAGATDALVSGDRGAGKALAEKDDEIEALALELDEIVLANVVGAADAPERLRYLIAVLRIVPHVERGGALAEQIAHRAARGLATAMSARARGLVERMGEATGEMWSLAADAYGERRPELAEQLLVIGDQLDELELAFATELVTAAMPSPVVVELALVGHFYERLGDHAVAVALRVPTRLVPSATTPLKR